MNSYYYCSVNNSEAAVREFFCESTIHEELFMRLLNYANSIDSDIGVRYNDEIIGASTIDSAFVFYVIEVSDSYEIKFKHLPSRAKFEEIDFSVLQDVCLDAINYVINCNLQSGDKVSIQIVEDEGNDTDSLLSLLKEEYGFKGFYHYTDFSNLKEILSSERIVCRNKAKGHFWDSADHTALDRAPEWVGDQVRLFYFPKTPFLYKNEGFKPNASGVHMPRPIALIFDESVAYLNGVKFLNGSAINLTGDEQHRTDITKDVSEAMDYRWDLIAYRGAVPSRDNDIEEVFGERDRGKITNCKNAEMLLPQELNISYLKCIAFRSIADYKQAVELFGESKLFQFKPNLFNNNHTFLNDYSIKQDRQNATISIALYYHEKEKLNNYRHHIIIKNEEVTIEKNEIFVNNNKDSIELVGFTDATKVEYYIDDILCAEWGIRNGSNK